MIYIRLMFLYLKHHYIFININFIILLTYSNATEIHIVCRLKKIHTVILMFIMYHFNKFLVSLYFYCIIRNHIFVILIFWYIYWYFLKVIKYFLNKSIEYDIYVIIDLYYFNMNCSKKYFKKCYFVINRSKNRNC